MLLDDFLPTYEFSERHDILIGAPREVVYRATRDFDMAGSRASRALMWIRQLPRRLTESNLRDKGWGFTLDDMLAEGFILLAEEPPSEIVLGAIGRFWTAIPRFEQVPVEQFKSFDREGFVKVAANFAIEQVSPQTCRLSTESRVHCLDAGSRRRFRLYWMLIRPFSGLIRLELLRTVKRAAETQHI